MHQKTPHRHTLVLPVSGRRVNLSEGDVLEIQMRQIVGSGSDWTVAFAPHGVHLEREEHFERGDSFSTRLFQFRAVRAGAGLLRLAIARPGTSEPLGHIDVHLTVLA